MQEKDTSTEEKSKSRTKSKKHKTNIVYQSGITSKEHYAAVQIIVFRR
jgi:predicted small secreted protein